MVGRARICLGQIGAPYGVGGEVRLHSFTADPEAIASYGPLETEDGRVFAIEEVRPAKDHFIARLSGVGDRDAASELANIKLYVPRERLPRLEQADEFYHADLIGLAVVDNAGTKRGTIIAVHNFGAGDLIEVTPEHGNKTDLIPFDQTNVPVVDISGGKITVNPSPPAGEGGEAKRSRVRGAAGEGPDALPLTRIVTRSRRQRSAVSRKGRG